MADQLFTTWGMATTGSTALRTMPDRLADVVNVMDFGATGDGVTNDSGSIQAAFDAAYGPSSAPHAVTDSNLNRAVYFPGGLYKCDNLLLTQVYGGRIYGAGNYTTTLSRFTGGAGATIKTNGFENSTIENMTVGGTTTHSTVVGDISIDLDWDNSGTVGLKNSLLINVNTGSANIGVSIAGQGFGGQAITLLHHSCGQAKYGIKLNGDDCTVTTIGGGLFTNEYGAWVNKGSYSAAGSMNQGYSTGGAYPGQTDILHNSSGISTFIGTRSEAQNCVYATAGKVNIIGVLHSINPVSGNSISVDGTGGQVSVESCILGEPSSSRAGVIQGSVNLSLRNVSWPRQATDGIAWFFSGFTGTIANWQHATPFTYASLPTKAGDGLMLPITNAHTATGAWGELVNSTAATNVGSALVRWNGTSSDWRLVGK